MTSSFRCCRRLAYWSIPPPDTSANHSIGLDNGNPLSRPIPYGEVEGPIELRFVGSRSRGDNGRDVAEGIDQLADLGLG